jgi:hypothetical protein
LLFVLVFGLFFESVHVGHRIDLEGTGTFTSLYTAPELHAHARDRAARWPSNPPVDRTRLAREDQYRTEGIQHVQARNRAWEAGDLDTAWRENLILEQYYPAVLGTGHRWPAEQREDAQQRAAAARPGYYISAAYPYPIYAWGWWWWVVVSGAAAAIVWWTMSAGSRSSPAAGRGR